MQLQLNTQELFNGMLLSVLEDDLSLPWNSYPCLNWPRATQRGYGAFSYRYGDGGKDFGMKRCHRTAFIAVFGPIAPGTDVCHRCDNPKCFRPIHLFAGSRADNMQDCSVKGRSRLGRKQPSTAGALNPYSSITEEQAARVKELHRQGVRQCAIRDALGISQSVVSKIVRGVSWTHVS